MTIPAARALAREPARDNYTPISGWCTACYAAGDYTRSVDPGGSLCGFHARLSAAVPPGGPTSGADTPAVPDSPAPEELRPPATPGPGTDGSCVRCGRPGSPWRLAAHVCRLCWGEAFATQAATDDAARQDHERERRAELAAAARLALADCGIRRAASSAMPDWAVLGLLEQVEHTPAAEVAAWTRPAVEPVGWLLAAREHADRARALRAQQADRGRFRPGRDWAASTVAVAQAVMHHAGREAGGRVLARPSVATLMAFTGRSERTVYNALAVLRRAGFARRVLAGTRVAGALPGRPVSLATVFELRIPLSAAELADQADLQRALQPAPPPPAEPETHEPVPEPGDQPDSGCPQPRHDAGCTPPSSAGGFRGSDQLESTGASRAKPPHQHNHPDPGDYGQAARRRRTAFAAAADQLRLDVAALRAVSPVVVEGMLRSWWERHQPTDAVPGTDWGHDLATRLGPWPPVWLVTNGTGLLFTKLARHGPTSPPPAPPAPRPGHNEAHRQRPSRPGRRRRRVSRIDEQLRQRETHQHARAAAQQVDRTRHYTRLADRLGWPHHAIAGPGR